jgi:dTDP-4-amino-4,6-dideoxygalactose transaminase
VSVADTLAVDGGTPVRSDPLPSRALIGDAERASAIRVFDEAIGTGEAFGYGGAFEQQYEADFAASMGGGFADAVNSGTNAVYCALGALGLDVLSEVICPPITDPGGIMPVALLGCVPVVADADPRTYNTAAAHIEPLITDRTRAIVVAHVGGEPVEMAPAMDLARRHGLFVVEDCAQAHGARYRGELVGTFGDVAAFSTMSGKHHCTGGQGGVVYTKDEDLHWRGRRFADRGKPFNTDVAGGNVVAGLNCNLNDLSAAIGSAQIARLPEIVASRRRIGEAIKERLAGGAVTVGWQPDETECAYWFLRLRIDLDAISVDKATFCVALAAEGIPVVPDYRHVPAEQAWFRERHVFGSSGFPWTCSDYAGPRQPVARIQNALKAVETHFNVAMHERWADREIQDAVAAVKKVEAAYSG